ncbi:MAG: class I SAM-dependent methyltransferase [Gemmatimonadota bacterium]|nr:class I SAM-dependent methyltransferase [Gemmatimonadota bacterium]
MTSIESVSDTALWVAVYRAMETARLDAIFKDPHAERLAGDKGVKIVGEMKRGRAMAWAMIVRTAVMDELILDRINSAGVDTVLNLAAGLDTRAWRLPLPRSLKWIDVDLPAITAYKQSHMRNEQPVCAYEAIAADLTNAPVRDALFTQVGRNARTLLVITEGLLIYLSEEEVTSLAGALHATSSARWWITDIASPMLLEWMAKSWGRSGEMANAPFKFGPADSAAFFASVGWREDTYRSSMAEARRLKREMRGMWFWRLMTKFMPAKRRAAMKKMSGILLLERADR